MSVKRPKSSRVLARQWRLLLTLSGSEWCVSGLAHRFGVSKNAIEHDIATLRAAGFPVTSRLEGNQMRAWTVDRDALVGMLPRGA